MKRYNMVLIEFSQIIWVTCKQWKIVENQSYSTDFLRRLQMQPFFWRWEQHIFRPWVAAVAINVEQNMDLHLHKLKEREKKIPAKIVTCPHWEFAKKHNSHLNLTKRKQRISSLFHFLWACLVLSDLAGFSPAWSHVDTGQFSWLLQRTKIYLKLQEWNITCREQELLLWDTLIPLGFHCRPSDGGPNLQSSGFWPMV